MQEKKIFFADHDSSGILESFNCPNNVILSFLYKINSPCESVHVDIPPMQAIPLESFADCVEELHEYDDELAENEYSVCLSKHTIHAHVYMLYACMNCFQSVHDWPNG